MTDAKIIKKIKEVEQQLMENLENVARVYGEDSKEYYFAKGAYVNVNMLYNDILEG